MTTEMNNFSRMLRSLTPKKSKSIAISFVKNSLSPHAVTSVCNRLAYNLEKTSNCDAYRLMNSGYRKLSTIAWHVDSAREVFMLIAKTYGSVPMFFRLLEAQRLKLETYARSCTVTSKYIRGIFFMFLAKSAKNYGTRFREEYVNLLSGMCTVKGL